MNPSEPSATMENTLPTQPASKATEKVEDCPTCTERFTKTHRKPIACPYCKTQACLTCMKTYVSTSAHEAHCMFCKVQWNEDFIRDCFSHNWLTKVYSTNEVNNLWEREKSLLPHSMQIIERKKAKEKIRRDLCPIIDRQVRRLMVMLRSLSNSIDSNNHELSIPNVLNNLQAWNNLSSYRINLPEDFDEASLRQQFKDDNHLENDEKSRRNFIKPCPAPNCRGFLSSQWNCALCQTKVCNKCFAIKRLYDKKKKDEEEAEHTCNADDLLTAEMIRKDSKNCPKCGVSIFKIEGCNQMFCTNCNTAFAWNNLEIINGNIHNPHYFQWLANRNSTSQRTVEQPTEPLNCNATTMPDAYQVRMRIVNYFKNDTNTVTSFIRNVLHIVDTQRRPNGIAPMFVNEDLRLAFLRNEINQASFLKTAYRRYKVDRFLKAKGDVYNMLFNAALVIINDLPTINAPSSWSNPKEIVTTTLQQIKELQNYFNTSIQAVFKRYASESSFEYFNASQTLSLGYRSTTIPLIV